jgi:hypothetical protein
MRMASAALENLEAFGGDFPKAADGEARPGERMAPEGVLGNAEELADFADFVLEEFAEGLDDAAFLDEGEDFLHAVVVGLDGGAGAARGDGLDDVRVEGALREEIVLLDEGHEDLDELAADDAALLLGISDTLEGLEEILLGLDELDGDAEGVEHGADLLGLVEAEESVVDEDGVELAADGAAEEDGHARWSQRRR